MKEQFNFWAWFRASFEENPNKASGKSISSFAFVFTFCTIALYVTFRQYLNCGDFEKNQADLIKTVQDNIVWLIAFLYGWKTVNQSGILGKVMAKFSGDSNSTQTNNTNTTDKDGSTIDPKDFPKP